jgi:hypothetical protein
MKNNTIIWIASSSFPAEPEEAKKFFHWLEEEHIPDLLKFKGMCKATSYKKITQPTPSYSTAVEYPGYITIYEFESKQACKDYATSPERAAAIKDGMTRWPAGGKKIWSVFYEPVKTAEKKAEPAEKSLIMMLGIPREESKTGIEFNKWVKDVYIKDLLRYKGLRNAGSYRFAADVPPLHKTDTAYPALLNLLEYENNQAARDYLTGPDRVKALEIGIARYSPDIDASKVWSVIYESVKMVEKSRQPPV